jgi:hypothetical protein
MLCYVAYLTLEQNSINDWPIIVGIINESKWSHVGRGRGIMMSKLIRNVPLIT